MITFFLFWGFLTIIIVQWAFSPRAWRNFKVARFRGFSLPRPLTVHRSPNTQLKSQNPEPPLPAHMTSHSRSSDVVIVIAMTTIGAFIIIIITSTTLGPFLYV